MTPSERREAAHCRSERWRRARWSLKRNAPLRELGLDLFGKQSIHVITPFDDLPINVVDGVAEDVKKCLGVGLAEVRMHS